MSGKLTFSPTLEKIKTENRDGGLVRKGGHGNLGISGVLASQRKGGTQTSDWAPSASILRSCFKRQCGLTVLRVDLSGEVSAPLNALSVIKSSHGVPGE